MNELVVVLGSNSFSGSHYAAHLLRSGYRVLGISRSEEPADVFLPYRWEKLSGFCFRRLDLNEHLNEIAAVIEAEKPAYIVNFASQGMVAESWKRPADWFRTNTLSQVRLHELLRHCSFLKKYVHVSTPEVYGTTTERFRETDVYRPTTPYAVSRAATDMSLTSFFKAYTFPVVFTRAANVYGPGQQLYRLIPRTVMAALGGAKMRLDNGGVSHRSFIHIRDVVAATRLIMEHGRMGEAYHISTDRLSSIREVAELAARACGVDLDEISEIGPARLAQDATYDLDSSKVCTELGWRAEIELGRGIAETVAWAKENLDILRRLPLEYIHKT